jgi:ABC-type multidrug transport system fused ATPase/permease subunit
MWQWISFTWMNPFIKFANEKELDDEDLPPMSLTQQTAIAFEGFRQVRVKSLLYRIFLTNKLDLMLDALLTASSVVLNYAGPFFLKRILDGLSSKTPESMSIAYIYALFALLASCLKGVSDLFHLWHSRRATSRIKAELTAAIYDKALRRKDMSGLTTAKEGNEGDEKNAPKSNADAGKVVNLMASDATRISNIVALAYYIYSSPIEIVIASIFLYK